MNPQEVEKKKRREHKRAYRARHRTYSLSYHKDEAAVLEELASQTGQSVPEYIRAVVKAAGKGTSYVVPDGDRVQTLLLALRRIGNNINQLVRYCHGNRVVTYADLTRLQEHLSEVESVVHQTMTQPPKLTTLVEREIKKDSTVATVIRSILESHRL